MLISNVEPVEAVKPNKAVVGRQQQRLLDGGAIGTPQTVLTLMQGPGPDAWHPRPQFLFAPGAGPLFDIGPYYFTTLVQLLGEIESVQALGHRALQERVVGSGPDAGATFPVDVWTHVSVLTRFRSGVVGTSIYSFDSPVRRHTRAGEGGDELTLPARCRTLAAGLLDPSRPGDGNQALMEEYDTLARLIREI